MKKVMIIILFGMSFFYSCSGLKVISDFDKTVDFSQFKTLEYYGWAENSDKLLNRFDKERIENATAVEFKNRNLDLVEQGQGDLIVTLFIVVEKKTSVTASTSHMGGGGYYYDYGPGWGWGGGHSTTHYNEYDYEVGTLIISVFDAEKKILIWEGIGEGTIEENPARREQIINASIQKIMSKFPVSPQH